MPPGCRNRNRDVQNVSISYCFSCNEMCLWVYDQLVWPRRAGGSEPKHLAPPNVRREYEETSQTLEASPRGAAARSRSANCAPAFSKADGPAGGQPCEAVCRAEDVWEHLRQSETTCFRSCVGLVSDVGGAIFVDGARLCSSWLASRRQHKKAPAFCSRNPASARSDDPGSSCDPDHLSPAPPEPSHGAFFFFTYTIGRCRRRGRRDLELRLCNSPVCPVSLSSRTDQD
jgi:hypothetical protein